MKSHFWISSWHRKRRANVYLGSILLAALFVTSLVIGSEAKANTVFDLDISSSGTNGPAVFYLGTDPTYVSAYITISFSNPGGGGLSIPQIPNSSLGTCPSTLSTGSSCTEIINYTAPGLVQVDTQDFSFTDASGDQITDDVQIEFEPELAPTPLPTSLLPFATGLGLLGMTALLRLRRPGGTFVLGNSLGGQLTSRIGRFS